MIEFTNCRDRCCVCAVDYGCLAGPGSDEFILADKDTLISRLTRTNFYTEEDIRHISETLKNKYKYEAKHD